MRKRIIIASDIHYCQRDWFGVNSDERMEHFLNALREEYERDPYEMILLLGDYSLDHWQWQEKGTYLTIGRSYTQEFVEKYCSRLTVPYYMIAGNHEQYGEEKWREITGCSRQFTVESDGYLFIMLDTFAGNLDPTEHHDGVFTRIDAAYLREQMEAYPNHKIILCSHYFDIAGESDEVKAMVNDERVLCLFCGHTHGANIVKLPEAVTPARKRVIFTGTYGECGNLTSMCGFRDLVITDHELTSSYYVYPFEGTFAGQPFSLGKAVKNSVTIEY